MKIRIILLGALLAFTATGASAQKKSTRNAPKTVPAMELTPAEPVVKPVPADSFSYAFGISQSVSLKQYITTQMGVDEAHMGDFIDGLKRPYDAEYAKKMRAFAAGLDITEQNETRIKQLVNKQATGNDSAAYLMGDLYQAGLIDGLTGKGSLDTQAAQAMVERQFDHQKAVYKNLNAQFLAENAKKEGVKVLPSGLQYKVIKEGAGVVAADTNQVEVHYEGKLIDGTVFDSSYQRGKTTSFRPNQVIKGWTEALTMMPEGSTWELYIPYDLAYGERGQQNIPPYSTLIFKVEVIKVK